MMRIVFFLSLTLLLTSCADDFVYESNMPVEAVFGTTRKQQILNSIFRTR